MRPQVKSAVTSAGRIIFSMDDENIYGPVFYRLNFGDAIQRGIISDYHFTWVFRRDTSIGPNK